MPETRIFTPLWAGDAKADSWRESVKIGGVRLMPRGRLWSAWAKKTRPRTGSYRAQGGSLHRSPRGPMSDTDAGHVDAVANCWQ